MPLPFGPPTSRRAALAAGAGGLVASGCGSLDAGPRAASDARDADTRLATDAATLEAELLAVVRDAGRGRPSERRRLAPLLALHRAHLAALPVPGEAAVGDLLPIDPEDVVVEVLARELAGAGRLRDWAVEADSGPLARLLASMAAGIVAHVEAVR